jgi:hypothetical protein
MRAWLGAAALLAACGGSKSPGSNPDAKPDGTIDADVPPGWVTLISRDWNMSPGQEGYKCHRMQVQQDMWISGYRALAPLGTHHEVVTIDSSGSQTGDFDCTAGTGTLTGQMVYASGVGTPDLIFPTGVAVHLAAGTWINLNLHLFDTTDNALGGESGVIVQTIPAAQVVHEADMTFSGTINISVPSDGQTHTAFGGCNAPTDWHVFALWPHMHQIAVHQSLIVTHSGAPTTMLDAPYMFSEQKNYPMPETIFHAGDQIQTTCSYVNNTGATVNFGDSSTDEMCFTGIYKYPAGSNTYACVN